MRCSISRSRSVRAGNASLGTAGRSAAKKSARRAATLGPKTAPPRPTARMAPSTSSLSSSLRTYPLAPGRTRGKQCFQNGPTGPRPRQVQAHEQRHRHTHQHSDECQEDVLDAYDLMVDAKDVLTYESRRRGVPVYALVMLN